MSGRISRILNVDLWDLVPKRWRVFAAVSGTTALWSLVAFLFYTEGFTAFSAITLFYAVLATIGAAEVWRRRVARRRAERLNAAICPRCNYDLHGSKGVRCPECGYWHGRRFASRGENA
jgi:hypothetical protein